MLADAFWLLKKQWSHSKAAFPFTIVLYALYGGLTGLFLNGWYAKQTAFEGLIADFVTVSFLSVPGFLLNRGYIAVPYWKHDTFTKQLAALRIMPIPVGTLALSRSLQVLILSPLMTASYFIAMYAASNWAKDLPAIVYLQFVLVWFGYGNIVSAMHIVKEWSVSGKRYLGHSFLVVGAAFAACIAVHLITGSHLIGELGSAMRQPAVGWAGAAAGIGAVILTHLIMYRKLTRILLTRNYV